MTFIVKLNFLHVFLHLQVTSGPIPGKQRRLLSLFLCDLSQTLSLTVSLWSAVEVRGYSSRQQDRAAPTGQVVQGETDGLCSAPVIRLLLPY